MQYYIRNILFLFILFFIEGCVIFSFQSYVIKKSIVNTDKKVHRSQVENFIRKDIKYFPIKIGYRDEIYYEDTYGVFRKNGNHEGCDILDIKNMEGSIPVVSATDGIVTNLGWLYLGGYRIGILSEHEIYYYYAHMDSYNPKIKIGDSVKAGELLGFMGNTGEGEEGTKGKFVVHLHFGIYFYNHKNIEESVNPYPFLREIERD